MTRTERAAKSKRRLHSRSIRQTPPLRPVPFGLPLSPRWLPGLKLRASRGPCHSESLSGGPVASRRHGHGRQGCPPRFHQTTHFDAKICRRCNEPRNSFLPPAVPTMPLGRRIGLCQGIQALRARALPEVIRHLNHRPHFLQHGVETHAHILYLFPYSHITRSGLERSRSKWMKVFPIPMRFTLECRAKSTKRKRSLLFNTEISAAWPVR